MKKILTTSPARRLTVAIKAEYLELRVVADPLIMRAAVTVSGPQGVLDRIRENREGDTWSLTWPEDEPSGRGVTVVQGSGTMVVTMGRGGSVSAGRNITINGVRMSDLMAQAGHGAEDFERVEAELRIPVASMLSAEVGAGLIRTRGPLGALEARTVSADVICEGHAGSLQASTTSGDVKAMNPTGPAQVNTISGDVSLSAVSEAVTVGTISGDIRLHVTQSVAVSARAISGDVRVTTEPGVTPRVSAGSISGNVSRP